jgi:hypothetical protein
MIAWINAHQLQKLWLILKKKWIFNKKIEVKKNASRWAQLPCCNIFKVHKKILEDGLSTNHIFI